jgi:hypothetical protein
VDEVIGCVPVYHRSPQEEAYLEVDVFLPRTKKIYIYYPDSGKEKKVYTKNGIPPWKTPCTLPAGCGRYGPRSTPKTYSKLGISKLVRVQYGHFWVCTLHHQAFMRFWGIVPHIHVHPCSPPDKPMGVVQNVGFWTGSVSGTLSTPLDCCVTHAPCGSLQLVWGSQNSNTHPPTPRRIRCLLRGGHLWRGDLQLE